MDPLHCLSIKAAVTLTAIIKADDRNMYICPVEYPIAVRQSTENIPSFFYTRENPPVTLKPNLDFTQNVEEATDAITLGSRHS